MIESSIAGLSLQEKLGRIMTANLSKERFGAADLAREAGLNRNRLRRHLKINNYRNVSCYMRVFRLTMAFEMLRNSEGTASEISYRVGFCNPAYFNRCFHEYFGITPGAVKKGLADKFPVHDGHLLPQESVSDQHHGTPDGEKKLSSGDRRNAIIFLLSVTILVMTFLVCILYLVILLGR